MVPEAQRVEYMAEGHPACEQSCELNGQLSHSEAHPLPSHGFPEPFLQQKSNKGCSESGLSLWPQPTDQSVDKSSPPVLSASFSLGRAAKYAGMERAVASVGGSYIKFWLFHNEPYEGASTLGISILLQK